MIPGDAVVETRKLHLAIAELMRHENRWKFRGMARARDCAHFVWFDSACYPRFGGQRQHMAHSGVDRCPTDCACFSPSSTRVRHA